MFQFNGRNNSKNELLELQQKYSTYLFSGCTRQSNTLAERMCNGIEMLFRYHLDRMNRNWTISIEFLHASLYRTTIICLIGVDWPCICSSIFRNTMDNIDICLNEKWTKIKNTNKINKMALILKYFNSSMLTSGQVSTSKHTSQNRQKKTKKNMKLLDAWVPLTAANES